MIPNDRNVTVLGGPLRWRGSVDRAGTIPHG